MGAGHHHHHHSPVVAGRAGAPDAERYTATRRVTILGAVVNVVLAVLKVGLGVVGHSAALVADGIPAGVLVDPSGTQPVPECQGVH